MGDGMTRRDALRRLGGAALAGALGARARRARADERPNMVFILADDLGYGDLGCYGQTRFETPCLDALAAQGMRFTQAYAGSTVCAPSRCALMTGLHTGHARIRGNALVPMTEEDTCVASLLREAGYATAAIGKWGLGEPGTTGIPNRQGFDYWFGYLNQVHAHNYYPDRLWRNEEEVPVPGNEAGACGTYAHDLLTEEALEFIGSNRERPFFLYLAYTVPHANNELGAKTGDGMEVPDYGPYGDKPWPSPERGKAAMIWRLDRDIGRIMRLLRRLGIDRRTAVFLSSDNGPHSEGGVDAAFLGSSGPLRGIKRDLYEGGIRVPFIVRWPEAVRAGSVCDHVTAFWDFLPTAADMAGAATPQGLDGRSILPALTGRTMRPHGHLYWEFHEGGFTQAVRMGRWKAVRTKSRQNPIELYDLETDIGETTNVAAQHERIVAVARNLFETARTDSAQFPIRDA